VNQAYSEKLDALKKEPRDNLESAKEFKVRIDKSRDELTVQRDSDLAALDVSTTAEKETLPIKAELKH